MKKENLLIRLDAACLPRNIYVAFEPFETRIKSVDQDVIQNQSGRSLITKMAVEYWDKDVQVITEKNEKPKAFLDKDEVSVSFSHTTGGVSAAISDSYNVGCDMENVGRKVHPGLMKRMKHNSELDELYKKVDAVRMWTLKESALKMIGTGLRKPMHCVQVSILNKNEFDVRIDDGVQAKICSFQHKNHWLSVCYMDQSDS